MHFCDFDMAISTSVDHSSTLGLVKWYANHCIVSLMLSIVGGSLSYFVLYTAHLQCYFLQCNCLQCSLARAYSIHTQALVPRLVDLVSWWQQSARVGFLIALHHRGSISWDVTDVPCMLSPSDRQRRTGLQAVARVCTPTLSTQQNPCAKSFPSFWSRFLKLRVPACPVSANVHVRYVLLIE